MKAVYRVMVLGLLLSGSGCVTMLDEKSLARQQADYDSLRADVDVLKEKLNIIQAEQQALARDLEAARRTPREDTAARARVEQLEQQIRAVNTARESDRRQIVDDLSKKVAGLVNASGGSASSSGRSSTGRLGGGGAAETGYEHVVKTGETLSAIAQAYKVTVSAIMKANAIKTSDKIRVGQKLFIPAP
jgi:LysM repeat protein